VFMKSREELKQTFSHAKVIIFDVDGTLYSSWKLKILLAPALFWGVILNSRILSVIRCFRKSREDRAGQEITGLVEGQYLWPAQELGVPVTTVKEIVFKWMKNIPLLYLPFAKYAGLENFIGFCREQQKSIVFYSDYPLIEKIKVLGISEPYRTFCAEDNNIEALKPNSKGLRVIMKELNLGFGEGLMIGDRWDRDEEAAKAVGMPCWIIGRDFKDYKNLKTSMETK
jgi:FMN phosphatase YigB (HAD superfamily)